MTSAEVAKTILDQMGGQRALQLMTSAHSFFVLSEQEGGVQFRFKGSTKANTCRVVLDANDTYTFQLWKVGPKTSKQVVDLDGVYCDDLAPLFEKYTGLTLRIPRFVTR